MGRCRYVRCSTGNGFVEATRGGTFPNLTCVWMSFDPYAETLINLTENTVCHSSLNLSLFRTGHFLYSKTL